MRGNFTFNDYDQIKAITEKKEIDIYQIIMVRLKVESIKNVVC